MDNDTLIVLLKIYSRTFENIFDGDRQKGMKALQQAADELGLEIPAIACEV